MIAGDHGCHPEWRRFSLADRDLRIGQDGAKRMDFSESEVSQMPIVQCVLVFLRLTSVWLGGGPLGSALRRQGTSSATLNARLDTPPRRH